MPAPTLPQRPTAPTALLALAAALLSACGGGGSDSPAPSAHQVALQFSAPAAADNVQAVGAAIPLAVGVTVDGAAAADGTAVLWSATGANFAPVQSSTQGGQAKTSMVAQAPGALQVQASASAGGQSTNTTRTLYLRPQPQPLEVLVPAYFYPLAASPWDQLTQGALAYPGLRITAIMNPNNGNFTRTDPQFARAIAAFTQAGGQVIGYVSTSYGTGSRSVDDVKRNIDRYLEFYGRDAVRGFFLDEMAATSNRLAFYREIYTYIKGLGGALRVVGNPGAFTVADYAGVADVLVSFEGQAADYARFDPQPANTWAYNRANTAQAMLVHDAATCGAMQAALQTAAKARSNVGLVYATDLHYDPATQTGNPWATLPSYWESLLSTTSAINRGAAPGNC